VTGLPLVTSRDYEEYRQMFGLGGEDLSRSLLDCPGGASDFAATVRSRGGRVVSVDPLYAAAPDVVARITVAQRDQGLGRVVGHLGGAGLAAADGLAAYVARRRRSAQRFLADFVRDRTGSDTDYVAAALPALPFADSTFEIGLVPNLLFSYADLFDRRWHRQSIHELLRVCAQVRIHPVVEAPGRPYAELDLLRAELAADGVVLRVVASSDRRRHRVDGATLVCTRRGAAAA